MYVVRPVKSASEDQLRPVEARSAKATKKMGTNPLRLLGALAVVLAGAPALAEDFCSELGAALDAQRPEKPARLVVAVHPGWGKVYVDGRFLAITPMKERELSPGRHCVQVRNAEGQLTYSRMIRLRAGKRRLLDINTRARKKRIKVCAPEPKASERTIVRAHTRVPQLTAWSERADAQQALTVCGSKRPDPNQAALLCMRAGKHGLMLQGTLPAGAVAIYVDGQTVPVRDRRFSQAVITDELRLTYDLSPGGLTATVDVLAAPPGVSCYTLNIDKLE